MRQQDVALVTATEGRTRDDDLPVLREALEATGIETDVVVWDDPEVDWAAFRLAVVRSTWDYALRRDEFLAWADRVGAATALVNPPEILRWNTDKRYLRELEALGVPIVPTTWLAPGDALRVPDAGEIVVKPAVSAGARDTARYGPDERDAAVAHAESLLRAGRPVMVQPYVSAIDEAGETGLVYCAGRFSHAFRKAPILRRGDPLVEGLYAEERITPRDPAPGELALGERVMDAVPGGRDQLLYARVDVIPGPGGPILLELEVAEPSLFLHTGPGSAARFAAAIRSAIP